MSKITKFIISLIMVIIAMSYITVSNAATEEELISYLSQTFNVNGGTFRIPDNYLKEAKRYVATYDVSPETADKIIAKVAGYVSKMQASGVSSTSELSKEQKQEYSRLLQYPYRYNYIFCACRHSIPQEQFLPQSP